MVWTGCVWILKICTGKAVEFITHDDESWFVCRFFIQTMYWEEWVSICYSYPFRKWMMTKWRNSGWSHNLFSPENERRANDEEGWLFSSCFSQDKRWRDKKNSSLYPFHKVDDDQMEKQWWVIQSVLSTKWAMSKRWRRLTVQFMFFTGQEMTRKRKFVTLSVSQGGSWQLKERLLVIQSVFSTERAMSKNMKAIDYSFYFLDRTSGETKRPPNLFLCLFHKMNEEEKKKNSLLYSFQ